MTCAHRWTGKRSALPLGLENILIVVADVIDIKTVGLFGEQGVGAWWSSACFRPLRPRQDMHPEHADYAVHNHYGMASQDGRAVDSLTR